MGESATNAPPQEHGSVDPEEVARFSALADEWWDPDGSFRPLHKLNPARVEFIRDRLVSHFDLDAGGRRPLAGLEIIDIGCGGGLICEPLCRMGARVTGIDASDRNVNIAGAHAEQVGLEIAYRQMTAEELVAEGVTFDAVVSLEVVEHVADVAVFLDACCRLARPGGALIFATLNRTPKSFLFGIVAAEYVLGWLPKGTHRWNRFVRPSELAAGLGASGARIVELKGLRYELLTDEWRLSRDVSVNYMALAVRNG